MAITLSLSPDHTKFRVEFPDGQAVLIPCTEGGAAQMRRLLEAQKAEELRSDLRADPGFAQGAWFKSFGIGTPCAPTQQEIDHELAHSRSPGDGKPVVDTCPFCRLRQRTKAKELTIEDFL